MMNNSRPTVVISYMKRTNSFKDTISQDPMKRMKIQVEWEKIFENYMSDEVFVSRIYKDVTLKRVKNKQVLHLEKG